MILTQTLPPTVSLSLTYTVQLGLLAKDGTSHDEETRRLLHEVSRVHMLMRMHTCTCTCTCTCVRYGRRWVHLLNPNSDPNPPPRRPRPSTTHPRDLPTRPSLRVSRRATHTATCSSSMPGVGTACALCKMHCARHMCTVCAEHVHACACTCACAPLCDMDAPPQRQGDQAAR